MMDWRREILSRFMGPWWEDDMFLDPCIGGRDAGGGGWTIARVTSRLVNVLNVTRPIELD